MFEDQKNPLAAGAPAPSGPASYPPAGSAGTPADDMFAGVDVTAPGPGAAKSAPPPEKPSIFQPRQPSGPLGALADEAPRADYKKYLVLGGLVLGMVIVLAGGWYGYKKFKGSAVGGNQAAEQPASEQAGTNQAVNPSEGQKPPEQAQVQAGTDKTEPAGTVAGGSQAATGSSVTTASAPDADDDGLTDEEEAKIGTNPHSVDSDNDGLFDRDEVKVWGTDPLKADTDGDGFTDGQEVKGGYNPLGAGKLFDNKAVK